MDLFFKCLQELGLFQQGTKSRQARPKFMNPRKVFQPPAASLCARLPQKLPSNDEKLKVPSVQHSLHQNAFSTQSCVQERWDLLVEEAKHYRQGISLLSRDPLQHIVFCDAQSGALRQSRVHHNCNRSDFYFSSRSRFRRSHTYRKETKAFTNFCL